MKEERRGGDGSKRSYLRDPGRGAGGAFGAFRLW